MSGFIHDRPGWPELIWDTETLAGPLAQVRYRQGRHLGKMDSLGFELREEAGLNTMTEEVLNTSAIEGEHLDPGEVRSSIARRLGIDAAGLPRPSRRVEGIVEIMLDAARNGDAPLTDERLFGWHAALFPTGRTGMQRITVGAWRTGGMRVVSGPVDRENIHFQAPSADRLQAEMQGFLAWFNTPALLDPVLKAGVAHFWFVTIHPFDDGNGRIARAAADMCLSRADGTRQRYYSMSAGIEAERAVYYDELETAQRGGLDITAWLEWFLACLGRTIENAEGALGAVLEKARVWQRIGTQPVNDRQRKVVNRMLDDRMQKLTTSLYAKLAKCSTDTALRDIRDLLRRRILSRNPGGGRSTSYRVARAEERP